MEYAHTIIRMCVCIFFITTLAKICKKKNIFYVTDDCLIYLVRNSLSRSVSEFYRTINLYPQTKWH